MTLITSKINTQQPQLLVITLIQSANHSYLGLLQADNVRVFVHEKRSTTLEDKIIFVFSVVSRSLTIISFSEYNVNKSPNNVSSNEDSGMSFPCIICPLQGCGSRSGTVVDPQFNGFLNPDPYPDPEWFLRIRIRIRQNVSDPAGSGSTTLLTRYAWSKELRSGTQRHCIFFSYLGGASS